MNLNTDTWAAVLRSRDLINNWLAAVGRRDQTTATAILRSGDADRDFLEARAGSLRMYNALHGFIIDANDGRRSDDDY